MDERQSEDCCKAVGISPEGERMTQTEWVSVLTSVHDCRLNEPTVQDKSVMCRQHK